MVKRLNASDPNFNAEFEVLLAAKREASVDVAETVAGILARVRREGDKALFELTNQFDKLPLTAETIRIAPDEIEKGFKSCADEAVAALRVAIERVSAYHKRQMPADDRYTDEKGIELGHRWSAVQAAGIYVPGGTAAYPSSVVMNAVPAQVAGVERIAMAVPCPGGKLNPLVLAAVHLLGLDEVYRIGGAQAIGALAFGTDSVRPVDKIVGPGNAYVAAAKRQVFGQVGIDMIAGPSEILVLADGSNDPGWIAADLLSQAEHDESSQSLLVTHDAGFADQLEAAVESQLNTLPRENVARKSWEQFGAVILVPSLEAAIPIVDRIAPEHLEIATDDKTAEQLAGRIRNAGAMFLGRYTPEAVGDYVGGPNHVLPTARSARFASGLSVFDFLKRSSILKCDADGLRAIGPSAVTLAKEEGLEAHARSITIRLN